MSSFNPKNQNKGEMSFLERIEFSLLSDDGIDNRLLQGHSDCYNTHDNGSYNDPNEAKFSNNLLKLPVINR